MCINYSGVTNAWSTYTYTFVLLCSLVKIQKILCCCPFTVLSACPTPSENSAHNYYVPIHVHLTALRASSKAGPPHTLPGGDAHPLIRVAVTAGYAQSQECKIVATTQVPLRQIEILVCSSYSTLNSVSCQTQNFIWKLILNYWIILFIGIWYPKKQIYWPGGFYRSHSESLGLWQMASSVTYTRCL